MTQASLSLAAQFGLRKRLPADWQTLADQIQHGAAIDWSERVLAVPHLDTLGWVGWVVDCLTSASGRLASSSRPPDPPSPHIEQVLLALLARTPPLDPAQVMRWCQSCLGVGAVHSAKALLNHMTPDTRIQFAELLGRTPAASVSRPAMSPWHQMVRHGLHDSVRLVLDEKLVDPARQDAHGRTAVFEVQHPTLLTLLVEHGLRLDTPDKDGRLAIEQWLDTVSSQAARQALWKSWETQAARPESGLPPIEVTARNLVRTRLLALDAPLLKRVMKATGERLVPGGTTLDGLPLGTIVLRQLRHAHVCFTATRRTPALGASMGITGTLGDETQQLHHARQWILHYTDLAQIMDGGRSLGWLLLLDPACQILPRMYQEIRSQWRDLPEAQCSPKEQWEQLMAWSSHYVRKGPIAQRWWNHVWPEHQAPASAWADLLVTPDSTGVPLAVSPTAPWAGANIFLLDNDTSLSGGLDGTMASIRGARHRAMGDDPTQVPEASLWLALVLHDRLHYQALKRSYMFSEAGCPMLLEPDQPEASQEFEDAFLAHCWAQDIRPHPCFHAWMNEHQRHERYSRLSPTFGSLVVSWALRDSLPETTAQPSRRQVRL